MTTSLCNYKFSKLFSKSWRSASTGNDGKKTLSIDFVLGLEGLLPAPGQEGVAGDLNECGLRLETDGRRQEMKKGGKRKGEQNNVIKHSFLPSSGWT